MIHYVPDYENKPTGFVSSPVKDEKYHRQRAESIYAGFIQERTGITWQQTKRFSFLRAFGNNAQPEDRYKDYFLSDENTTPPSFTATGTDTGQGSAKQEQRKGYMSVLWDIVSPAVKIINTLVGKFEDADFEIVANPIDSRSKDMIEDEKIKLYVEKENLDFLKATYKTIGIQYDQPEFIPETQDELELYEQTGGFKPAFARIMEEMIKSTMSISDWNEIKKSLITDFINIGVGITRDYYDESDHKIRTRYVDPEVSTIQFSTFNDHHDSEYFGEFVPVSVSFLLSIGFTRTECAGFAKSYSGYYGNPGVDYWAIYDKEMENGTWGYDFYKVCVFDCEWIDTEETKETLRKNKFGEEKLVQPSKKPDKNERTRILSKRFRYNCKWIVGTEHIYDWGKAYDIIRPTKKDVALTAHCYKLPTKSITEQLYPIYDNFMILWLKYQNAIATAVNSGYVVYTNYLKNIKAGGGKNPEREALKRFMQSGILLVSETDQRGNLNSRTNRAVEQLPGGMGAIFTEIMGAFVFNSKLIEDIAGMNPIAMGATPQPEAGKWTSEVALAAMSSTLKPILSGYMKIETDMASNVCRWIQLSIQTNKDAYNAYVKVFGKFDMEIMKVAAGDNVELGITLNPAPTAEEWRMLLESAAASLQAGRSGIPGISEADYFAIMRIKTSGGSLAMAELMLQDRIRRAKKDATANAKALQDNQTQGVMMGEQLKAKQTAEEKQLDHQMKMVELAKAHEYKMAEIAAQEGMRYQKDTTVAQVRKDAQVESTVLKQDKKEKVEAD